MLLLGINLQWPIFDAAKCGEEEIEYAVQINSKIKIKITVTADMHAEEIEKLVKNHTEFSSFIRPSAYSLGNLFPSEISL